MGSVVWGSGWAASAGEGALAAEVPGRAEEERAAEEAQLVYRPCSRP
jgi:hypothetical protein